MAAADGSGQRPLLGLAAVGALTLLGVIGFIVVLIGLGGASGPAATPTTTIRPSPSADDIASPSAAPSPATSPARATSAASPDAPVAPAHDPLLAGLLTTTDLPGLTSPLGPQEGTDYDIDDDAFAANDGIRVVSQEWRSLADTGFAAVFDFRMQFPSAAAASAYLAAAEPVLSEADATGQAPIPSPPVIGSDGRVYGLETNGDGGPVLLRTYLFREGPVVAKVEAGGPGVTAEMADALARTAAARIRAAGVPATGSPRPVPSPGPTPAATAPLPTGEALAALLLEHVPPEIGPSCVPDSQRLWTGELATLVCTDEVSGVTVTYSGFDSSDAAEAAFDASLETIDLSEVADSCDLGPYVGSYELEGEEVGRVACWLEQDSQAIMWTDDRLAILAVAVAPTLDPAGLYLWWLGAGPVL